MMMMVVGFPPAMIRCGQRAQQRATGTTDKRTAEGI